MPFRSQAQRRKFYHLKSQGKMDQSTIDEWEKETPKKLPEKVAEATRSHLNTPMPCRPSGYRDNISTLPQNSLFWQGFHKQAGSLTGGKGFTGAGKGNLGRGLEYPEQQGTQESHGRADQEDTRASHELLDRDRTARDFSLYDNGPEFYSESNPHVKY